MAKDEAPDIPAIKARYEADKSSSQDIPLLVTALKEAQGKLDAVRVALAGWELNGSPRNSLWDRVDGILKGE